MKSRHVYIYILCIIFAASVLESHAEFILFAPNQLISRTKFETLRRNFNNLLAKPTRQNIQLAHDIIDTVKKDSSKQQVAQMMANQLENIVQLYGINIQDVIQQKSVGESITQNSELTAVQQQLKQVANSIKEKTKKNSASYDQAIDVIKSTAHSMAMKLNENQSKVYISLLEEKSHMLASKDAIIEDLQTKLQEAQKELAHVRTELDLTLVNKFDTQDRLEQQLKQTQKHYENQLQHIEDRLKLSERNAQVAQEHARSVDRLVEQHGLAQNQAQTLASMLQQKENELQQLQQQLKDVMQQKNKLNIKLTALDKNHTLAMAQLEHNAELLKKVDERAQIAQKNAKMADAQRKTLQEQSSKLAALLAQKESTLNELQFKLQQTTSQCAMITAQLKEAEKFNTITKAQFNYLSSDKLETASNQLLIQEMEARLAASERHARVSDSLLAQQEQRIQELKKQSQKNI